MEALPSATPSPTSTPMPSPTPTAAVNPIMASLGFTAVAKSLLDKIVIPAGYSDDQYFSSPDGLAFSPNTGISWIQTDDGAYTDVTNCMILAAIPGKVGDGAAQTLSYTKADTTKLNVLTQVGAKPTADKLKRFLVGPKDCEITGLCETPVS